MHADTLIAQLRASAFLLDRNLDGLREEQTLDYPHEGNCINWLLGHVTDARNGMLRLLGGSPPYDDADFAAYAPDPGQELPARSPVPTAELRRRFGDLGERIGQAVAEADPADMGRTAPFSPTGRPDETVSSLLATIAVHEAYHIGQIGMVRRALGVPGNLRDPRP